MAQRVQTTLRFAFRETVSGIHVVALHETTDIMCKLNWRKYSGVYGK
jgi:hypothetical protein